MMKKLMKALLVLPFLFTSLIFHSPAAIAADCTKAQYAQTPACLALQKPAAEEVNSFSALAQKAAAQAAARAAAAKGIKPTIIATTPLAIVTPIPRLTPAVTTPSASPTESVIPLTIPAPAKAAAKSSASTKSKSSKAAKVPTVAKKATEKKPATVKKVLAPKKPAAKKTVKSQAAAPAQDQPSTSFVNKVVTVECTNGKKTTKVTSAKPMCPSGFWRK